MKTYSLPLSPNYVKHWGLWQSIRELIQNAYDEEARNPECKSSIKYETSVLTIETSKGKLSPNSLVLGESDKEAGLLGKFGEGYKLALLVLCRLEKPVFIRNGNDAWAVKLEYDLNFGCRVLKIEIQEDLYPDSDGVLFNILNISLEEYEEVSKNICPLRTLDSILFEDHEKGRIYVGGLYVQTAKDFHFGYAFSPGTISLDRDRSLIRDFDLSWATSALISRDQKSLKNEIIDLFEEKAPDVYYVEHHTSDSFSSSVSSYFHSKHGEDVIPVSNQREIQKATKSGVKWILVPESLKNVLRKVKDYFLTPSKSPSERLKELLESKRSKIPVEVVTELESILEQLEES